MNKFKVHDSYIESTLNSITCVYSGTLYKKVRTMILLSVLIL